MIVLGMLPELIIAAYTAFGAVAMNVYGFVANMLPGVHTHAVDNVHNLRPFALLVYCMVDFSGPYYFGFCATGL